MRNKRVELKLTETEYFILSEKANRVNMNHSELLRNFIYFGTASQITNFTSEDAQKIVNELSVISNSMNQIAYIAKIKSEVSEKDFDTVVDNLKDLFIQFDNFVQE